MAQSLCIRRGTRAQIDTAMAAGQLALAEPYLVTDERCLAVGTGTGAYALAGKPTIDQIAGLNPTLDLDFANQVYRHYSPATGLREKALSDIVTFTRAFPATYFDAKGVMQTAASDVPRIDFDPVTGECKGLLIEESRVNSFLNSLLDGTSISTQTVTVTAAPWTISFYGTGSITLSGAHVATITGTSNTARTALTFTPSAGSLLCTVSGTAKWANCEIGSFATSFIPTAGATATRAADIAVISGTAFSDFYRQGIGTILLDSALANNPANSTFPHILSISDGAYNESLSVLTNQFSSQTVQVVNGGVSNHSLNYLSVAEKRRIFSLAYKNDDLACSLNAGVPLIATSGTINALATKINIGSSYVASALFTGHFGHLSYFPARLPNTTLQHLSAG
jgi:hypothetical protein